MKSKALLAPAKINLCLHVLGRRSDGYHDLAMLMQRVALFDKVTVCLTPGASILVDCPGLELPEGAENIAARAARLMLDHVGQRQGVAITVNKGIPAAAGLGGGSSDAAAVLLLLDDLLGLNLPLHELMMLGGRLGADVPFFLFRKTAWATGIGDILHEWRGMLPVWALLVNPGIPVATAWVYQNLRLTHPRTEDKIPRFPVRIEEVVHLLHNDLESVTCSRYPVVDEIKSEIMALGAAGALMSGSGPTVFGLFPEQGAAENAARALSRDTGWWSVAVSLY
ncbi:MAG: 4-(cytidine 5'-diphospho)-2-C-methyl-D-erythritol kinase [Desulfuromonadales bacterium]|nr:4-(cytidine 5'-diphospho)-2-C-methyl-D-erythritol kinase [Desulfuromonadales bacterium]